MNKYFNETDFETLMQIVRIFETNVPSLRPHIDRLFYELCAAMAGEKPNQSFEDFSAKCEKARESGGKNIIERQKVLLLLPFFGVLMNKVVRQFPDSGKICDRLVYETGAASAERAKNRSRNFTRTTKCAAIWQTLPSKTTVKHFSGEWFFNGKWKMFFNGKWKMENGKCQN